MKLTFNLNEQVLLITLSIKISIKNKIKVCRVNYVIIDLRKGLSFSIIYLVW